MGGIGTNSGWGVATRSEPGKAEDRYRREQFGEEAGVGGARNVGNARIHQSHLQ